MLLLNPNVTATHTGNSADGAGMKPSSSSCLRVHIYATIYADGAEMKLSSSSSLSHLRV